MTTAIGKVINNEVKVEWSIRDFLSLKEEFESYLSPFFHFLDESWYLEVSPNGERDKTSTQCIGLYLMRREGNTNVSVSFTLGVKTSENKIDERSNLKYTFDGGWDGWTHGYGCPYFLARSKLKKSKSVLLPSGVLTITCYLRQYVPSVVKRIGQLSLDLEALLEDKSYSDVTFKVETEEFQLHRNILGARSPVFAAMFKHDMKEKFTGIVSIEDCSAHIFRLLVDYVYTGKVNGLSHENAFQLCKAADKYQLKELVQECLASIGFTLSRDTFCDAAALAILHNENIFKNQIVIFLSQNIEEIVGSNRWEKVIAEEPVAVSRLLSRAFKYKENKTL